MRVFKRFRAFLARLRVFKRLREVEQKTADLVWLMEHLGIAKRVR